MQRGLGRRPPGCEGLSYKVEGFGGGDCCVKCLGSKVEKKAWHALGRGAGQTRGHASSGVFSPMLERSLLPRGSRPCFTPCLAAFLAEGLRALGFLNHQGSRPSPSHPAVFAGGGAGWLDELENAQVNPDNATDRSEMNPRGLCRGALLVAWGGR